MSGWGQNPNQLIFTPSRVPSEMHQFVGAERKSGGAEKLLKTNFPFIWFHKVSICFVAAKTMNTDFVLVLLRARGDKMLRFRFLGSPGILNKYDFEGDF